MNDNQAFGQANDQQIKEWKTIHKTGIYAIIVDNHIAYFKNPNRQEVNCALSKADTDNALGVFEMLANITFIGGSEEIMKDDRMFIGMCNEMKVKLDGAKATLVNL